MHFRRRDAAALVLVVVALVLGTNAFTLGERFDPGIDLSARDGLLYVVDVNPYSPAYTAGIRTGMVVIRVDDTDVLGLPDDTVASIAARRSPGFIEAVWPESVAAVRAEQQWIAAQAQLTPDPVTGDTPQGSPPPSGYPVFPVSVFGLDLDRQSSFPMISLGFGLFLIGLGWLAAGRAGDELRRMAVTLPAAIAVPLLGLPWMLIPNPLPVLSGSLLLAVAMLPLAVDISERITMPEPDWSRYVIPVGFAAMSMLVALAPIGGLAVRQTELLGGGVAACAVFVPGVLAAWPVLTRQPDGDGSAPRASGLADAAELVMVAAAPGVAVISTYHGLWMWPIVLWILAILALRRFTLRPLARLAQRVTLQRDAIVAATEAERARIAADIHDDALQDLTMLIRRLDAAGDSQNAEAAREVAARLRAICGELRLPILDDLGLGPALEWLTQRYEPIAPGPIYLDRIRIELRLPRDVELALFRICQEALANAVRHGLPPIVVRYRSGGGWAELEVDDAGPGLAPGAATRGAEEGHFGLLNMAQRAEQVNATLDVGRRPGGGTRVSVVWQSEGAHEPAGRRGAAVESGNSAGREQPGVVATEQT